MSTFNTTKLTYFENPERYFSVISELDWPIWLDSGYPTATLGRYDIFSANPKTKLITHLPITEVITQNSSTILDDNPLEILKQLLKKRRQPDLPKPFSSGALGYFSYDLAWSIEQLPHHQSKSLNLPDMAIGLYDWAIVVDHHCKTAVLYDTTGQFNNSKQLEKLKHYTPLKKSFNIRGAITSNLDAQQYQQAFNIIQQHIRNGECYQVNLAQRFRCPFEGDSFAIYQALRAVTACPFSGYFRLNKHQAILSFSPERFIQLKQNTIHSSPIKGTRPRGQTHEQDVQLKNQLLSSDKDKAENLMIVDLLRNDLGKVSEAGSVKVTELFKCESYQNVHHLVSTIQSKLKQGLDATDIIRATFPGGSITGAPKIRAMQIIEQLEPDRRSFYTGSLGYIADNGDMDLNIGIRSIVTDNHQLYCWAGGGIVADSKVHEEYQETFDKVSQLLAKLTTHQSAAII